jgi:lipoate-protein ligase A
VISAPDPVQGTWALDEDLIAAVRADGQPRSAVYPHPDTACVIGSGGDPWLETQPELLLADSVPLLRRRGGGCAVVVDPGNLICSLVLPLPGIGDITRAFTVISASIGQALASVGVAGVVQAGVSDLAVGGRKLGGSCIWRTRNLLYYSTTVLVDPRWELIDRYLPHPPREPEYRAGRLHRAFLTSVRDLGCSTPMASLQADLADHLSGQRQAILDSF